MAKTIGPKFINAAQANLEPRLKVFRALLVEAVNRFNAGVGRKLFVRKDDEQLPTHSKHVSSVRARMGSLLEYELTSILNDLLHVQNPTLSFTYNYVTEYPDIYLRDANGNRLLRIEFKTLHDEADEGASRFDTWTKMLRQHEDIIVVAGWHWVAAGILSWPEIIAAEAVSGWHLAQERDWGHKKRGGTFGPNGEPYVTGKRTGRARLDQGNYGKLQRIVHRGRCNCVGLNSDVKKFLDLLNRIYPDSPKRPRAS